LEVQRLRDIFNCRPIIVAVCAGRFTRFKRLKERGRKDDPKSFKEFMVREDLELSLGVGILLGIADYVIISESYSNKEEMREKFKELLKEFLVKNIHILNSSL